MVVILAISTYIFTDIGIRIGVNPGILPIASVVALLATILFINRKMEGWAFVMTGLNIILTQVALFSLMFPRVMVSSLDPAWSLTIDNTAASPRALEVMSLVALIFIPIVVAYESWSYYIFRKRVKAEKEHLVY
jgi:cytochrome d ubiquinol oxidase subunit II